jgi:hypothetical protein
VRDVAAPLGVADQLLDGGVRKIEQRAVRRGFGVLVGARQATVGLGGRLDPAMTLSPSDAEPAPERKPADVADSLEGGSSLQRPEPTVSA